MFSGNNQSTEKDFQMIEFHGDTEDGLDWSQVIMKYIIDTHALIWFFEGNLLLGLNTNS